jgi:hypothetical protein
MTKSSSVLSVGCTLLSVVACGGAATTNHGDGSGGQYGSGGVDGTGAHNGSGGAVGVGGYTGTGGYVGTGGIGTGGYVGTNPIDGYPLISDDGWVQGDSNALGIQGALFGYADATTAVGMTEDFTGSNACIAGTAAQVDLLCTPTPPATDCYGEYWGAAIGLNLNQPIDPETGEGSDPLPYDASALAGFGFTITGSMIPNSLRFKVENANGEFCTPAGKPILEGNNTVLFSDVVSQCWTVGGDNPNVTGVTKIAWQVVTNDASEVPFDFCVSNIVAIPK